MKNTILSLLFLLLANSLTYSDEAKCGITNTVWGISTENCICGEDFSKLKLNSPYQGLNIVRVCDYKEIGSGAGKETWGKFVFTGSYAAEGEVIFKVDDDLGGELYFEGGIATKAPPFSFYDGGVSFRFEKAAEETIKFGITYSEHGNTCTKAKVKIIVSELHILIDGGTDAMGEFPMNYKIINLEKPTPCSPRK